MMTKMGVVAFLVAAVLSGVSRDAQAQVVPYRVTGDGVGNLATGVAFGEAVGLHLGQLDYDVERVWPDDPDSPFIDTQTAADGSTLVLLGVRVAVGELSEGPDSPLVRLVLIDEYTILCGTGRFKDARAVDGEPIISTTVSEPIDPFTTVEGTYVFQKVGKIDLGKKKGRK